MGKTYTCARCGGRFESDWSEEEAQAEYERNFPGATAAKLPREEVCDDCYKVLMARRTGVTQ